jgi:hypothetical protein
VPVAHRRYTILGVILVALALAIVVLLLTRTPTIAPPASSVAVPTGEGAAEAPIFPEPDRWTQVSWDAPLPHAFGPADPLLRVDGVMAGEDLVLAWGRTPMPGRNQFNDMGAVFASADGVAWQAIPMSHGVEPANASTITGIAAGPGGYLAIGSVCCAPERSAVWRSIDGLAWQRLELLGDFDPTRISPWSLVAVPDGWVVLGETQPQLGAELLFSADGQEWESVLVLEGGLHRSAASDLVRVADGVLVVGTVEGEDGSYDGGIWHSPDGRRWERRAVDDDVMAGDGEVQLTSVVAHTGGLIVNGIEGTAEQRRQCEELLGMVASIGPPPGKQPDSEATSCMSGDERTWTSRDGTAWQVVERPGGEVVPIEFRVMVAAGPGLVVLGETSAPASPDTALFTSADGLSWEMLDDGQPMRGDMAIALVARGRELIAITERWDGTTSTLLVWRGRGG